MLRLRVCFRLVCALLGIVFTLVIPIRVVVTTYGTTVGATRSVAAPRSGVHHRVAVGGEARRLSPCRGERSIGGTRSPLARGAAAPTPNAPTATSLQGTVPSALQSRGVGTLPEAFALFKAQLVSQNASAGVVQNLVQPHVERVGPERAAVLRHTTILPAPLAPFLSSSP
jgi:hypothetical protein